MAKEKTTKVKGNPLGGVNWPQILSITANNLKIHKNAEEIHNVALKWSGMDASIREAEHIKDSLTKDNQEIAKKKVSLLEEIINCENKLADFDFKIKDKAAEIERLDKILRSDLAERKRIIRVEFNKYKTEIDTSRKSMEDGRKELFLALDSQLEKKNKQIDDADVKIKKMADKLTLAL